ncbi:MAG: PHP domain-containing protein [Candidatus Thioglobus sp.]|uniref:PHP domain-containing protein n=1 Tax=Candidatus Thioglobus sp. TaxID=2026721 RepID=UPI00261C53EA|nr:PHP domain-containing protein [Candidatus Thioglobus sp.]MDC9726205.1 PHP domain-containing protein [Candidatus Thioglobus sp.]
MIIDLHNHSYYSDGVLSPTEVVNLAKAQECNVFALTDHDTTDGLIEAQQQADKVGLRLIHGVEVSAMWGNMTVHIVGLGVDINNATLQDGLKRHQEFRRVRAEKMARGLGGAGVFGALEKTQAIAKTDMITRTHFAQMLVQEGVCKDMRSVFKRFLTGKKPGGVGGKWAEYDEVISWIHAAGGQAVLAHPLRYRMTNTKVKRLLSHLAGAGLDGVEVVTGSSSADEITLVGQWAKELNLLSSQGSDYHGWPNQRMVIGKLLEMPNPETTIWRNW